MGNSNSRNYNSVCVNCLECQNEIKTLNEKIYELHALVEIKTSQRRDSSSYWFQLGLDLISEAVTNTFWGDYFIC